MAHSHVPTHPSASRLPSHPACDLHVILHPTLSHTPFVFPIPLLMQLCVKISNQDYECNHMPSHQILSQRWSHLQHIPIADSISSHPIPHPVPHPIFLFCPMSSPIPSLIPVPIEMIVYVSNPTPLMQCITRVGFCKWGHPRIPGTRSTWSGVCGPCRMPLDSVG